jgi:hypothetical protein
MLVSANLSRLQKAYTDAGGDMKKIHDVPVLYTDKVPEGLTPNSLVYLLNPRDLDQTASVRRSKHAPAKKRIPTPTIISDSELDRGPSLETTGEREKTAGKSNKSTGKRSLSSTTETEERPAKKSKPANDSKHLPEVKLPPPPDVVIPVMPRSRKATTPAQPITPKEATPTQSAKGRKTPAPSTSARTTPAIPTTPLPATPSLLPSPALPYSPEEEDDRDELEGDGAGVGEEDSQGEEQQGGKEEMLQHDSDHGNEDV